jgi:hypothetical protein
MRAILVAIAILWPISVKADGPGYVPRDAHTGKISIGSQAPMKIVVVNGNSSTTYSTTETSTYTQTGTTTGVSTGVVTATQLAVTLTMTAGGAADSTVHSTGDQAWTYKTGTMTTTATATLALVSWNPTLSRTSTDTMTLSFPQGTVTALSSGTVTIPATALATTTPGNGAIPAAGTDSKIGTAWQVANSTSSAGIVPQSPNDGTQAWLGNSNWGVPPYAAASGSSTSLQWTTFFNKDLTTLTDQNLLPGDGQKTLSDGSHIYVGFSGVTGAVAYVHNGTGIQVHAHETFSRSTAMAVYWRIEDMGSAVVSSGDWSMVRCSVIAAVAPPTVANYGSYIGGFYGQGTGTIPSDGIVSYSWAGTISAQIWAHSYSNVISAVAREGQFFQGVGSTAQGRTSDTGTAISGSPKDLFTLTFDKSTITVYLGTSDSGEFPTNILSTSTILGTGRGNFGGQVPFDVAGVYAGVYAHVNYSDTQEIYLKKIKCSYK